MSTPEVNKSGFYGYPGAKEVVDIKFKYTVNKNPVLRGTVLVFGAWMYVFPSRSLI
jgi:hypothetical protein